MSMNIHTSFSHRLIVTYGQYIFNLPNILDHDYPNLSNLQVLFSIQKISRILKMEFLPKKQSADILPTYSEVKKPKLVD